MTASKYLYLLEKIQIHAAVHYTTILMDLAVDAGADKLVLSLIRFAQKLKKMMLQEAHEKDLEIPQFSVPL